MNTSKQTNSNKTTQSQMADYHDKGFSLIENSETYKKKLLDLVLQEEEAQAENELVKSVNYSTIPEVIIDPDNRYIQPESWSSIQKDSISLVLKEK